MQQFYSLIILIEPLKGKEITLPNGCYIIHSCSWQDKKDTIHKTNITLDIQLTDTSLTYIKLILSADSYTVYYKTNEGIPITERINYNTPFFYDEKALFSVKKTDDHWDNATLTLSMNHVVKQEKTYIYRHKKQLFMMIFILIILVVFWVYNKNRNKNDYKNDTKTIINKFIRHNGYIQESNHFLFIMKSDDKIPDDIYNKLKHYVIYTLTEKSLKHSHDDIIKIKKNDELIDIIYISKESNHSPSNIDIIPEVFRDRIKTRYLLFNDIITLINKSMWNDLPGYFIIKINNKIIVSSGQENNINITKHINEINKTIFKNDIDKLVSYKQTDRNTESPGIYGKKTYRISPGDHIDFTLP